MMTALDSYVRRWRRTVQKIWVDPELREPLKRLGYFFAGFGLSDDSVAHFTEYDGLYAEDGKGWLKMYLPARSAVVLRKVD